jgi:hypothetical protein
MGKNDTVAKVLKYYYGYTQKKYIRHVTKMARAVYTTGRER